MQTQKPMGTANKAVAHSVPKEQTSSLPLAHEAPVAIAQRKAQEAVPDAAGNPSPGAGQEMADNSSQVKQLKAYQAMADQHTATHTQPKENRTGLPDALKSGVEQLSGLDVSDIKVHYHSPKPAQLQAHAYAQGTDIHIAPGKEQHLAHEAWHVVQQKQGRVQPTLQMKSGISVNNDSQLEKEADLMGGKALQMQSFRSSIGTVTLSLATHSVVQRVVDWAAVEKTAADNYAISADHSTLYSKGDIAGPEPTSMYTQGVDTTNDDVPLPLKTWKPNVKFLTGSAIDHGHVPTVEERAGWADESIPRPTDDNVLDELRPEYQRIKTEVTEAMEAAPGEGGASPTMGIVGRNDCAQWATALQGLIYRTREAVADAEKVNFDLGSDPEPNLEGAPAVGIGDKMEQKLGGGAASGHHGATVVATDGASLVTLEAHVEKQLTAPEFHLHAGLSGFVDSNNAGPEGANQFLPANGRNGTVSPLGSTRAAMQDRMTMLEHYSGELSSDNNSVQLGAIQGLLRYYEAVEPEVEAEIEAEVEAPVEEAPRRKWRCCFLTTACVTYRNLPDDCEELTVLRAFRDNYMSQLPEGDALIGKYYEVAPGIVAAIDRSPKRRDIYEELYLILRRCVDAIKQGNHALALDVYKNMVVTLHEQYKEN